jgi:hypothetical protein
MQLMGKEAGRALIYVLIGMIIGALVALHEAMEDAPSGPLAATLAERIRNLGSAFRRVVFAQVRISLINTTFTPSTWPSYCRRSACTCRSRRR